MPFITFEGIDGSGKSSLIKNFAAYLKDQGLVTHVTREPGGSELGREIRELLLKTTGVPPCPEAELLLYEADRAQHVATKIRPWLAEKAWVLSDRFADSSFAFQGAGRNIKTTSVKWLNDFATAGVSPDLTVIVDCPVDVSFERLRSRETQSKSSPDRFEKEKKEFHQRVRDEYLKLAPTEKRFFVLDGTQAQEAILLQLIAELSRRQIQ